MTTWIVLLVSSCFIVTRFFMWLFRRAAQQRQQPQPRPNNTSGAAAMNVDGPAVTDKSSPPKVDSPLPLRHFFTGDEDDCKIRVEAMLASQRGLRSSAQYSTKRKQFLCQHCGQFGHVESNVVDRHAHYCSEDMRRDKGIAQHRGWWVE